MHARYGSPYSIETTHIKFLNSDLCAEVMRSLFKVTRQYRESFDVYASQKSFEWSLIAGEKHVMHMGGEDAVHVDIPDCLDGLPKEVHEFAIARPETDHSRHGYEILGTGHGGAYPHMINEFLSALMEGREPYPNAVRAANITCSGILSHESALRGGEIVRLPEWTIEK